MNERVDVMHGVNLDQLGHRDPEIYGDFTLSDLEIQVKDYARELGLHSSCRSSRATSRASSARRCTSRASAPTA